MVDWCGTFKESQPALIAVRPEMAEIGHPEGQVEGVVRIANYWLDLILGRHGNAVRCLLLFCLLVVWKAAWRARRQNAL